MPKDIDIPDTGHASLLGGASKAELPGFADGARRNIAVVTLPLAGHMNPMGVLVESLRARGHRVSVVGPPGLCDLARQHMPGVATFAISDSAYPPERLQGFLDSLPEVRGLSGIKGVIKEIAALTALYTRQLPQALDALGAEVVVHDQLEPGAGLAAKARGLAQASVACALPMNREDDQPPPFLGWPLRNSVMWRSLYGGAWLVTDRLMKPQGDVLEEAARRHGLPVRRGISDWVSEVCDISQCAPGFDYPREGGGPEHLGPFRREDSAEGMMGAALDFERDGRELVFCSLGTIMGGRVDVFEAVARACAERVVQCVIAHGGRLDPDAERYLEALPGAPVVRDFVDQRAVLREARAGVLHGGFNSVLDALGAGVPMVLLPMAFEQGAIAARVKRAGAGRVVKPGRARSLSDRVGRALDEVLEVRSYRENARRIGRESALAGGVREAVRRIEALPVRVMG